MKMRLLPTLISVLVAVLALAAGGWAGRVGGSRLAAIAGADVRAALALRAWVPVVVALRDLERIPLGVPMAGDIAGLQQRVLARLGAGDFRLTQRWHAVPGFAGRISRAGLDALARDARVQRVDLDAPGRAGESASTARAEDDESLRLIRGDLTHSEGYLGAGTTVALLSSGVDRTHTDLSSALVAEHCFVPPSGCPNGSGEQDGPGSARDDNGIGTNEAGILVSSGAESPVGIAPGAKLVAVKVIDSAGRFGSASQVISGLDWLIANHPEVRVVVAALGTDQHFPGPCDSAAAYTLSFASAINTLRARGALVLASSGFDGSKLSMGAPACIAAAVSTGAVYDANVGFRSYASCVDARTGVDAVPCFSDSGLGLDLLAPGAVITATGLGGGTSNYWGTAQAASEAAGAAAVLLGAVPSASADAVESALKSTGVPITDRANRRTTPRIDLAAAVAQLAGLTTPPPSPPPPAPPAPVVAPLSSAGRSGGIARLRLIAADLGLELRFHITVRRGPATVASFTSGYLPAVGRMSLVWRVPKALGPGRLSFCVRAADRGGPPSPASCARLTISKA